MNIYYVTDEVLNASSVESVHVYEICKNLADLGHTVTLYAPATNVVGKESTLLKKGFQTKYIQTANFLFSIFFQLRLFLLLSKDISAHRPHIIYSRHNNLLFIPVAIGKLHTIPTILEVNGKLLEESRLINDSWLGRLLLALGIFYLIELFNAKFATKLIVVAPGIRDYLIGNFKADPNKINVVRNAVNADFFKPSDQLFERQKIGLNPHTLYVGYIGSLYQWQGLRYMVEAARSVLVRRPDARFLIVGDGEEFEYLRTFIKKCNLEHAIQVRTKVPHNLVRDYINALDVCVCYPTRFRNGGTSPFKVYEYLACGKPVILADIDGMRDEFGDVVAYAEPESVESLSTVLVSLIDDKNAREKLGKKARLFIEQDRSWEAVTKRIVQISESIVKTGI